MGAGTITANLRFDSKTIKTEVRGKLVDTGRRKLGCVFGDNIKTGVHISIMPGVLIGRNSIIHPHSLVKKNIDDGSVFHTESQKLKKEKIN